MYLGDLPRVLIGNSQSMSEANARAACEARGGILTREPANYRPGTPQIERPIDNYFCALIPAASASAAPAAPMQVAPITVNTNTQVSPQISPNFIQQDEPKNSPVTAGATQSAGPSGQASEPTTTNANTPANDLTTLLATIFAATRPQPQDSAPANSIVQVPAYVPASSTSGGQSTEDSVTLPTPFGPSVVSASTFSKYAPWAAMGIIAFAVWRSKRK